MGFTIHCLLSFLFILAVWSSSVFCHQSSTQKSIMLNLFHFLHNPQNYYYNYYNPPKWNASTKPCTWEGVICTNNSVTQLHLSNYEINNSSVISIACQIQSLQALDVSNNVLDSIPDDFITRCGKLPGLKSVNFSYNSVYGNLTSFRNGGFANLESLDMSSNSLYGSIGAHLYGLVVLKSLNLNSNQLNGSIPSHLFGNMKGLQELDLSYNNFQGRIPEQFPNCNNLRYLDLSSNKLTGTIPADLGLCQELLHLNLAQNRLSGELPTELGNLKQLQVLSLDYNNFVGKIPHEFTQLFNLKRLSISCNSLSGSIPRNIGNLYFLIELQLSNNLLGGTIPLMPKNIQTLDLSNNSLSGGIPSQLIRFGLLSYLDLSSNNLSGPIPTTIQKFGYQAFGGNNYLCGYPVGYSGCDIAEGGDDSSKQEQNEGKDSFYIGLYVSIGIGFYLGFWGVCGTLVLKHTWRYAFFNFIDTVYNRIYVTVAIYIARFQRKSLT